MAYTTNAATNKVPAFGVPGAVTPVGGSALTWDIISISVTQGNDLVEHRDANGKIVSRTYFNQETNTATAHNASTTISISAIPVGSNRAGAVTAAAHIANGEKFSVAGADIIGSLYWECTGLTHENANTDNATVTLTGVLAVLQTTDAPTRTA